MHASVLKFVYVLQVLQYYHCIVNKQVYCMQIKETDSKMAAANSFTVYAGNRLLVVAASSEMEKNKWMEDLEAVIEHPSNRLESDQIRYGSLKSNSE